VGRKNVKKCCSGYYIFIKSPWNTNLVTLKIYVLEDTLDVKSEKDIRTMGNILVRGTGNSKRADRRAKSQKSPQVLLKKVPTHNMYQRTHVSHPSN
jgi:hypothetical protein